MLFRECRREQRKLEKKSILGNKLNGYADDSTLMAGVPSPGVRATVAESLIRDLDRVREWLHSFGE